MVNRNDANGDALLQQVIEHLRRQEIPDFPDPEIAATKNSTINASGDSERPVVRTRAKRIRPALLSRSLTTWRWIMRSRFLDCGCGHFCSRRWWSRLLVPRRRRGAGLRRLPQADPGSEDGQI